METWRIVTITGLSCGLLGSMLLAIEFIGVTRVQSLLIGIRKLIATGAELANKASLLIVGGAILFVVLLLTKTNILKFIPPTGAFYWLNAAFSLIFFSSIIIVKSYGFVKRLLRFRREKAELRHPRSYLAACTAELLLYLVPGIMIFIHRPPDKPLFQQPNQATIAIAVPILIGLIAVIVFLQLTRTMNFLVKTFYKEDPEEQIRLLGISGLTLLTVSFIMQIAATLAR